MNSKALMNKKKTIPVYNLYGEQELWPTPDLVHCESIAARSELHNWQIKPHQHNGLFQLLYLQAGHAQIQLDEQRHDMHAGQLLLVPQMYIHGFKFDQHALGHVITIAYPIIIELTKKMKSELTTFNHPSIHTLMNDEGSERTRMAINAIALEYQGHAPHRDFFIVSLLTTILIWVSRNSAQSTLGKPQENEIASKHLTHFGRLIEEEYATQHLVTYYANKIGITAAHLNVICRQNTEKSALNLIHDRLLLEAKRNLVYTNMSISVMSYALGFADPAYFTRFFKRNTGMSPMDFRKQAASLFKQ
jgi:AraC family transcriptional activator of pobA